MDSHLDKDMLMEGQQRGVKEGCSGTTDNLMIDKMITLDCHRGKRNLSMEYKLIKTKAAIKLFQNQDPLMRIARMFEERSAWMGYSSLVKYRHKYAQELGISLKLDFPEPSCSSEDTTMEALIGHCLQQHFKTVIRGMFQERTADQKWQGSLVKTRWEDEKLNKQGSFAWLSKWQCTPTHTMAGVMELYEQLLPTRVYTVYRTGTLDENNTKCRLWKRPRKSGALAS